MLAKVALTLVLLTPASLGAQPMAAAPEPRRVVIVYDERTDLPGLAILDAGLVQTLTDGSSGAVEIYRESLDLSRFGAGAHLDLKREYLRAKYAAKKIDVVIAAMGPSLDFVLQHAETTFPGVPIVFCGIDRRELAGRMLPDNVTGVLVRREFAPTLEIALKLHPNTTRVVFVGGAGEFDARLVAQARGELRPYEDRLAITYLTTLSLRDLLAELATLPPQTLVLYATMFQDAAGESFVPHDVAERVAATATAPVYGFLDQYIGRGIVGGRLYSLEQHGQQAAAIAQQILAGARPSELPLKEGGAAIDLFDWRQLQRWGLREEQLPAGSTIRFKETGLFEQYPWQIAGAALLVVLQTAMIAALLLNRARRRRMEDALKEERRRYALASAAGAVGIWDWNFETNELFIDESLKSLLGFGDDEISSRPDDWGSRVYPQDVPLAAAGIQACVDGRSDIYEIEHRMLHKDGSVKWMLSRGSAIRAQDGRLRRMVGTKVDITERKAAEELVRESEMVLRASHQEIQVLAGRLIASQENERARIARELHDDLSQQIAGLAIALSGMRRRINDLPDAGEIPGEVASLQKRTHGLADIIRRISHSLHPSMLEHAGLVASVRGYCEEIDGQQPIAVSFTSEGDFDTMAGDAALCLYRVTQESLRNAVTHSHALHVRVHLERMDDQAALTVADDGRGFDVEAAVRRGDGLGLVSIVERVRLAGGTVSIVTENKKGTRVRVQLPVTRPVSEAAPG